MNISDDDGLATVVRGVKVVGIGDAVVVAKRVVVGIVVVFVVTVVVVVVAVVGPQCCSGRDWRGLPGRGCCWSRRR